MKLPRQILLLIGLGLAHAPVHGLTPIDLDRLKRVNNRIDHLYLPRTGTPPPIIASHNPFRVGAEPIPTDPRGLPDTEIVAVNDETLLLQAAATLKITGVLETGGRMRAAINTVNYAEGDVIQVRLPSGTVFLRVITITARSVTLRLNEASHTLQF
jgi:hypothetical protein